jgi:hypothetical protein
MRSISGGCDFLFSFFFLFLRPLRVETRLRALSQEIVQLRRRGSARCSVKGPRC